MRASFFVKKLDTVDKDSVVDLLIAEIFTILKIAWNIFEHWMNKTNLRLLRMILQKNHLTWKLYWNYISSNWKDLWINTVYLKLVSNKIKKPVKLFCISNNFTLTRNLWEKWFFENISQNFTYRINLILMSRLWNFIYRWKS